MVVVVVVNVVVSKGNMKAINRGYETCKCQKQTTWWTGDFCHIVGSCFCHNVLPNHKENNLVLGAMLKGNKCMEPLTGKVLI